jgi:phosphatidylserine/phosphatidylglycerophosphate/cardiolipin synthase-like enzyme
MSVVSATVGRVDKWTGQGVEGLIRSHHRRRLSRAGRLDQLDPPTDGSLWAAGGPAPREGCELDVLIDGAEALPAIQAAMTAARSTISIAGWHLDPDFGLTRDDDALRLRDLLAELAEKVEVRVLLWAGAPLHLFTPDRSEVRRVRDELTEGTRVECALDAHERPMHCHHEKLVIVDDRLAFVGGIDLTALGGDRYDRSSHPMRSHLGWHDASTRLQGPAVADVAEHFAARWKVAAEKPIEPSEPVEAAGSRTIQVVRTMPEKVYDFEPRGDFRILEGYVRALRSARTLIYLESQFLWSTQITDVLAAKLRDPPSEEFRVVIVLPAKPNNGADSSRGQLGLLADADAGRERFLAATLSSRSGGLTGPLYVHAKIGIVDDRWMTVGSANLNDHSLFNDTEMNVLCCDADLARATRRRLWAEHLELPIEQLTADPATIVDQLWRPIAREQLERRHRGDPATHHLLELPGVSRRSMALAGPLQGLVVDG